MATTKKTRTTATKVTVRPLVGILSRSNKAIKADRAARISGSIEDSYTTKRIELKNKLRKIENRLDEMLDLSASANTTVDNAIRDFDADAFVKERHQLRMERELIIEEVEILKEDMIELFGEEV
jgi:translation initiation factor 2B subunit (eIF-2B alpha/beta/delta family)